MWLNDQQLKNLQRAYYKKTECPVPTQVISSGECFPPPQTKQQAQVESLIQEKANFYEHFLRILNQHLIKFPISNYLKKWVKIILKLTYLDFEIWQVRPNYFHWGLLYYGSFYLNFPIHLYYAFQISLGIPWNLTNSR